MQVTYKVVRNPWELTLDDDYGDVYCQDTFVIVNREDVLPYATSKYPDGKCYVVTFSSSWYTIINGFLLGLINKKDVISVHSLEQFQQNGQHIRSVLKVLPKDFSSYQTKNDLNFIHCCSNLEQVKSVVAKHFQEQEFVILEINTEGKDVRLENGFPHIYGDIHHLDVIREVPLE